MQWSGPGYSLKAGPAEFANVFCHQRDREDSGHPQRFVLLVILVLHEDCLVWFWGLIRFGNILIAYKSPTNE